MISLHQLVPSSGQERAQVSNGYRNAKIGAGISRLRHVQLESESRAIGPPGVCTVANHQGHETLLAIVAHVEKGRAFGRAQPLVAVAGVIGSAELAKLERDHPRSVGSVHEDVHPARLEL